MDKLNNEIENISKKLAEALKRQLLSNVGKPVIPTESEAFLSFNKKEILKMPKCFRTVFRAEGCTVHFRKRISESSYTYEARYRRHGYNISVTAKTLVKLKKRFIEVIRNYSDKAKAEEVYTPKTFKEFAEFYFEKFRKRKVTKRTFDSDMRRYKRYLLPTFGNCAIKSITPAQCQDLLDEITAAGHSKTAEEVYSLLNVIFKMAQAHYLIEQNPLAVVYHEQHERVHGKALTLKEEEDLLTACKGSPYRVMFAVALYTGLRPNEFSTAKIEGQFIVARNSKRKNQKIEFKKIPISPKLREYLDGVDELVFYIPEVMRDKLKKILPNHKLYDLRTTFYSRCIECGVNQNALMEFMGHSRGKLGNAYTDLSDDFLLKEGSKLNY